MKSVRSLSRISLLTAALILAVASLAQAQSNWAVARRDDASLQKLLGTLSGHAKTVPGADGAVAVVLYKQRFYQMEENGYRFCTNMVFLVKDAAKLGQDLTAPYFGPGDDYPERSAFVKHGNEIRRLDEKQVNVTKGDGEILRDRMTIHWGDLTAGDIAGWSVVESHDGPLLTITYPACDRYPVVYASLRILNNGKSDFIVEGRGVASEDFSLKTNGLVNDRTKEWKATIFNLKPVPTLPGTGPYPVGTPLFSVALKGSYIDQPHMFTGWIPTNGWVTLAAALSQIQKKILENAGGVDVTASALTSGLADESAKEKAICEFVRDKIETLGDDRYDRGGLRSTKQVISEKKGTPLEKVALMVAMLNSVGIEPRIALARPEKWGKLDDENEHGFTSFLEGVVRCGMDEGRYYAPQCSDCAAGTLPADWGKAELFFPKVHLLDDLNEYNKDIRSKAFASKGQLNLRKINAEVEGRGAKMGWYHFETYSPE